MYVARDPVCSTHENQAVLFCSANYRTLYVTYKFQHKFRIKMSAIIFLNRTFILTIIISGQIRNYNPSLFKQFQHCFNLSQFYVYPSFTSLFIFQFYIPACCWHTCCHTWYYNNYKFDKWEIHQHTAAACSKQNEAQPVAK